MQRLETFVELESGRGNSSPHLVIRGSVFPGLTSSPWHDTSKFEWVKDLEASTGVIRNEVMNIVRDRDGFKQYHYPGVGTESWQSLVFYKGGRRLEENCERCPETVKRIEALPGATLREAMISLLEPEAYIKPHRDSGNQLLTCHLGLRIPPGCAIRVGGETRTWTEGRCLIFDTTFEHEAWNKSDEPRVVLLVDFWHPDLSQVERDFLLAVTQRIGHW
jgi:aspartate beta-hydroxylase